MKITRAGGIDALLAAMRGHKGVAEVQEAACGALRNLAFKAENHVNTDVFFDSDGRVGGVCVCVISHAPQTEELVMLRLKLKSSSFQKRPAAGALFLLLLAELPRKFKGLCDQI